MNISKVVLMHGKDTDPTQKWYPWLISKMNDRNIKVVAPILPKPNDPVMGEWLKELDKANPDENTILIGHSRGCGTILRWLEKLPKNKKVKKVILIAPISGFIDKMFIKTESNFGFYTKDGYNFDKIKEHCDDFVVMHSKDDPWVPFESGVEVAKGLKAKFLKFDNYRHFGYGFPEIPELLEEIDKTRFLK